MAAAIGAILGLMCGEILRRRLNQLTYRVAWEDESGTTDERQLTNPGPRWWIPPVLAGSWALVLGILEPTLTIAYAATGFGWLALCVIGLWLAVIDVDVRRLPDSGQLVLAGTSLVAGVALAWNHPATLLTALVAALLCGLGFLILHLLSRGALGFGDVKLVMTCGWWLGLISPTAVFTGLMVSCLLALGFSLINRAREFAFGPWLLAGTVLAGLGLPLLGQHTL
ncbi:MAG: A24 family peptidase [Propionibacteriaceae bacterium]|nr:A24 family peptidase [Propionibacteriaceae bacterium]